LDFDACLAQFKRNNFVFLLESVQVGFGLFGYLTLGRENSVVFV
jgi:hypothetical protein